MDIKEAIETLKDPTEWYEDELTLKLKYAKAKDMAIEALEKQIAKPFVDNSWCLECPTCHAKGLTPNEQIYCHKCGQMIDWHKYCD